MGKQTNDAVARRTRGKNFTPLEAEVGFEAEYVEEMSGFRGVRCFVVCGG